MPESLYNRYSDKLTLSNDKYGIITITRLGSIIIEKQAERLNSNLVADKGTITMIVMRMSS